MKIQKSMQKGIVPFFEGVLLVVIVSVPLLILHPNWINEKWLKVIEIEGFFVGISAVLFAGKQYMDSAAQMATLSDMREQLSTQYVAPLPRDLHYITKFIFSAGANENVDIMVDFAGYGSFSNHGEFRHYFLGLRQRADNASVRLLIYGDDLAEKALRM